MSAENLLSANQSSNYCMTSESSYISPYQATTSDYQQQQSTDEMNIVTESSGVTTSASSSSSSSSSSNIDQSQSPKDMAIPVFPSK